MGGLPCCLSYNQLGPIKIFVMHLREIAGIYHTMTARFDTSQLLVVVGAVPDPALVIGEQGIILASNKPSRAFFDGDVAGKHLTTVLRTPSVLQAVNEAILEAKSAHVSHLVRTPVQRSYDVHISPMGVTENDERIALLILRDLTYEEQIERMRSDFVANASHELRTPLASLTGFIETMQGAAKNDTKARGEFLKLMKAQADRMARLIDDLLSLSRIEISEHVPPTAHVDLNLVTKQAVNLLAPMAKAADCTIRIDLPQSLQVIGDGNQLAQVVHNLIENAIKYAGTGKAIDISGGVQNGMAVLSVRDDGPGIAAHHVPRLTERFYRVSVQDSRNRGGTGLGLAITKHILNRHRGKLVIQSEVGKGSIFSIHLPIVS
jgi:two-component system, OmpR family, phosphate regulon sensor histidine kinase PhoR